MIDLHKHLRKYEILQTPFRPRFGYKYCGLQKAKLEDQVLYDKDTGDIIKTYDKEKNNLDSICKKHDICTVGVAKIFRFTCTLFWSIPTYNRTLTRSFSEK